MAASRLLYLALVPTIAVALTASAEDAVTWETSTAGDIEVNQKSDDRFDLYLDKVQNRISSYGHFCVGVAAILCNAINVVVLGHQKAISPYVYLKWVAVCDLLTGVVMIWQGVMLNKEFLRSYSALRVLSYRCQVPAYFLRSTLAMGATYIVCALGMDRLIAVLYPMKRAIWCTKTRAHTTSVILIITGIIPNFHLLIRVTSMYYREHQSETLIPVLTKTKIGRDPSVTELTQYSKFILKQILPLTVMVVTSAWTIVEILKSQRFRKQVNAQNSEKKLQCFGVTIGVIVLFILTNTPLAFYALDKSVNGVGSKPSFTLAMHVFLELIEFLPWTNSFLNFFIYILLNDNFRQEAVRLFLCRKKIRQDYSASMRSSTYKPENSIEKGP